MSDSFSKEERLCKKKYIYRLINEGNTIQQDLFFVKYLCIHDEPLPTLSVLITIPKRNFKKAVHRNKIKRRIKEAYRKNKKQLKLFLEKQNKKMLLMFVYNKTDIDTFLQIESKIKLILQQLIEKVG